VARVQDLRRALASYDQTLMSHVAAGLIRWRFINVNPRWGFLIVAGNAHVIFEPVRPKEIFRWVDQFLEAQGLLENATRKFTGLRASLEEKNNN
jgi:hypothetical protein